MPGRPPHQGLDLVAAAFSVATSEQSGVIPGPIRIYQQSMGSFMGVFMGNKHSWGSKIVTFENFLGREVSHPHWKILKLSLLDAAHLLHRSRMISRFHPSKSSSEARWHFSLKFCATCHADKETGDPVCPKWNVHLKKVLPSLYEACMAFVVFRIW